MVRIAVFASGRGTNFEAIAKAVRCGYIKAILKLLITDRENALARQRAKRFKVKDLFINPKDFSSRLDYEKAIIKILKKEKIDLVVLAGFMRILSPYFVREFKNRILNIHPALLPAFKGKEAIRRAFSYGCKVSGITVHFVDERVDHGPIILQEALKIKEGMSLEEFEEAMHNLEHKLYPWAIKLVVEKKIRLRGRHVWLLG